MTIASLFLYVFFGILVCILYYSFSNFLFDFISKKDSNESSISAFIFIAPAFIILLIYILCPVFETVRLSFFDKYGRDFVGINNYIWAVKDPEFRRGILNNLGWLLIVPTLSTFFGFARIPLFHEINFEMVDDDILPGPLLCLRLLPPHQVGGRSTRVFQYDHSFIG